MRHKNHHTRMNRPLGHRTATLRNLARSLVLQTREDGTHLDRIETTVTKAKTLRPFIENLITLGKKGTVHHRRQAFSKLQDKHAVHRIFTDLAPRFSDREGGYTRIIRTRTRPGDAAEMAYIEFVERTEAEPSTEDSESAATQA